jgi:hypothetical protein
MKLFTPGHGFFMDSLIMYGLVSSLPSHVEYYVSGNAGLFEIEIESRDVHDVANFLASYIERHKESIIDLLVGRLKLIQKGSQKRLESYLSNYSNSGVFAKDLEKTYMSPGHAQKEGRRQKGQHVWLPLYPHIGKYFTGEYKYSPSNYGVCPLCIALATIGFYRGTIKIPYNPPKNASLVVLLSFEGEVSGKEFTNILSHLESEAFDQNIKKLRLIMDKIPLNTFIYVLLANLAKEAILYLYESKAAWTSLSTTFNIVKGQVAQIRGYEEIFIDKYLSSLVYLTQIDEKYKINSLKKLQIVTENLIKSGEPAAIEALYRFMNTRSPSDLYMTIRQITKATGVVGRSFCEELAWLTQLA